jgi:uncharacterized protein YbjQ (UPF0145 family)
MMAVSPPSRADSALACLAGQGGDRHKGRTFSSDLSVDEAVLLKEIGYEPCGLVVGSGVYHIGIQYANWSNNEEMVALTQVMYQARQEALTMMERHAAQVGGRGVVGLRLDVEMHAGPHPIAEFVAMGTAVAAPGPRSSGVWVSDLSGQDLYLLIRAGYQPVGLAFGACVYHVAHQGMAQVLGQTRQNVELSNFTAALYEARELAMSRMQQEAERQKAHGIVAMRIDQKSHIWGSHVIEFLAVGTAVRLVAAQHQRLKPEMAVSLDDEVQALTDAAPAVPPGQPAES